MIYVSIVDNHQVLIDTLELVLNWEVGFELVGSASDLNSARQLFKVQSPDVLLLEAHLPDGNGLDIIPYIKDKSPKTRIIILTSSVDDLLVMRAIQQEVNGILSKGCSLDELLTSIRMAANDEIMIPSKLLLGVLRRQANRTTVVKDKDLLWEELTNREMDVLNCLALGKSGHVIARELHIAPLTVRTHIRNLMSKLGVHTRLEAVSFALSRGIIESPR